MSQTSQPLGDSDARTSIRDRTDATLFVDAGAGSGKTQSLVGRVTTLVLRDRIPLSGIAAVTFTEKAGAELRDRLRAKFEVAWRDDPDSAKRLTAEQALSDLDSAAIGTLHSFAQRILTTYPIEAGLPPLIEVLDEVGTSVAFDESWSVLQRELLDDAELSEQLLLAMACGTNLEQLRSLAKAFGSDWDLVEDRVIGVAPTPTPLPDLSGLADEAARLALRSNECTDAGDKFLPSLANLGDWAAAARSADTARDLVDVLLAAPKIKLNVGRKASWPDLAGLKIECTDLTSRMADALASFTNATLRPLARWIAEQVLRSAAERAADGRLQFHDLLVLTRRLLRNNSDVRESLHHQYQRLLLDEFQDTDPIQIELAVRIAAGANGGDDDWRDVEVPAGSLFVVGDPKQSIYRFRRADIRTYLAAQEQVGDTVALTTNFRTVAPVLDWVNEVFGTLITSVEDAQPAYQPLSTHRTAVGHGDAVTILGLEEHAVKLTADALREAEAADVAAVVGQALAEAWTVMDPATEEWRPIRRSDVAILLPTRIALPFLQEALDLAGVPYRAESSSLVYQAAEIRSLMAAARTLADPTDLLSCVTALRSPLFGCGDDDLWTWKQAGGSFNILATVPNELANHPVGVAMSYLGHLYWRSRWMPPSELLAAIVSDGRMLEVAATEARARDVWRRLRFVVDHARAWSEAQHGGLRAYLAWAARQGDETARVAEAVLPELDVDAVRIMTVHSAKGLEFGMVVMAGMTSAPRNRSGVEVIWPRDGGWEVKLNKLVQTNDFQNVQPLDEQMDQYERIRLLYVAATRARDHLVVSLHRNPTAVQTSARVLADGGAGQASDSVGFLAVTPEPPRPASFELLPPPDFGEWEAELDEIQASTRASSVINASGLEGTDPAGRSAQRTGADPPPVDEPAHPGAAKGPRDVELPPWSKGRYGTAVGRAVHAVLQQINLATGEGLAEAVSAQCVAEGVVELAEVVSGLVRSALSSPIVTRAVERQHWRESYVATKQPDGVILEGFIDLVYREDDGSVVVVDYKTDEIPTGGIGRRTTYYRPQIDAYCRAVAAGSGASVRGVLLFLQPGSAAFPVEVMK
ncbi:ATP-dependent exoDNAse (exonuclease V) beta subunit [Nakamurella sp. UYEF19]|uniref:UvrD-helicase domain-containing protein n=1 Tax=Nakamurella sp. UYEF19 TaxID=1756392 RepID=UPI003399C69B